MIRFGPRTAAGEKGETYTPAWTADEMGRDAVAREAWAALPDTEKKEIEQLVRSRGKMPEFFVRSLCANEALRRLIAKMKGEPSRADALSVILCSPNTVASEDCQAMS
jgi:hypothetical protein